MLSFIYSIVPTVTGMGKATVGKSVLTPRVFSFTNLTAAENFSAFDSLVPKDNNYFLLNYTSLILICIYKVTKVMKANHFDHLFQCLTPVTMVGAFSPI